jgi:hypothetical protein
VIEATVANIVGPAVAAHDPHAFPDQHIGNRQKLFGFRRVDFLQQILQQAHSCALTENVRFVLLRGGKQGSSEILTDLWSQALHELARKFRLLINRNAESQSEFSIVLE